MKAFLARNLWIYVMRFLVSGKALRMETMKYQDLWTHGADRDEISIGIHCVQQSIDLGTCAASGQTSCWEGLTVVLETLGGVQKNFVG